MASNVILFEKKELRVEIRFLDSTIYLLRNCKEEVIIEKASKELHDKLVELLYFGANTPATYSNYLKRLSMKTDHLFNWLFYVISNDMDLAFEFSKVQVRGLGKLSDS